MQFVLLQEEEIGNELAREEINSKTKGKAGGNYEHMPHAASKFIKLGLRDQHDLAASTDDHDGLLHFFCGRGFLEVDYWLWYALHD